MTYREWFFLFMAIFGWICGFVAINDREKTKDENNRLRKRLLAEHDKLVALQTVTSGGDNKQRQFFDFEKVNGKKEK